MRSSSGERVAHADGADGTCLLAALRRGRVDVDAVTSDGPLVAAPAERLVDPAVRRDLVAEALGAGYPGVRLEAPVVAERPRQVRTSPQAGAGGAGAVPVRV